jgi:ferritin
MLNEKIEKLLNEQFVYESYSANLYLSMSAYLSNQSLDGYATWYWVQYLEELDHAHIIFKYIVMTDGHAEIGAIDQPPKDFDGLQTVLEQGLAHEQYVTGLIYNIANVAAQENDLGTVELMQWFIKEQVEEESNASNSLGRFNRFGGDTMGLYKLDADMGTRIYTPAPKLAEYGI